MRISIGFGHIDGHSRRDPAGTARREATRAVIFQNNVLKAQV
jgi:hypothetical protein